MTPLVSVIIPIFNNDATIDRAIDSVLAQTVDDVEIVVVDDGSVDGGFERVVAAYGRDPRFQLLGPRTNTGPSIARNLAIDASRGRWIALLDGDDAWKPQRLAHLLAASQDADFVADNLSVYDSGARMEVGTQFGSFDTDVLTLADHLSTWPGARSDLGVLKPIMRRAFLEDRQLRYDPAIRCGEDFVLYAMALSERAVFRLIEDADYIYTATFGPKSRSRSPHSRTVPDGALVAASLRRLLIQRADQLTADEREALDLRATAYEQLSDVWAFRSAILRRDIAACAAMLLRNAVVRRRVRDAVARRLLGPLGPRRRERIVAHKAPGRQLQKLDTRPADRV